MTRLSNAQRLGLEVLFEQTQPPPPVDYLQWAKANIVFSDRITQFPGPYNEALFPFFSEILKSLTPDDPCRMVTISKSAQVGGTVLANIFTLGTMDMDPCDFLYVHPTEENASRWSKQKLMPLLRETTSLAALFPEKSRDGGNSIHYKERADGRGAIQAAGANSPSGLSMISPRKQVQDDLSKWQNNEAGDPESQAESRSKAFIAAKILKISTPLIAPGCRISSNFERGSQEYYHVPCPHCRHLHPLEWEHMRDHIDADHPERACFYCPKCGSEIREHHRAWMVDPANGAKWVAKYPERARYHRSFHIWVAYSPLESWEALARAYLNVQSGGPDDKTKKSGAEQVFYNDWLGAPFETDGEAVDWEVLRDRAELGDIKRGVIPPRALILTIGIDVQGDRVEWQLVGNGKNRYRVVIDRGIIDESAGRHLPGFVAHSGHISEPQVQAALSNLIRREWPDCWGNKRRADLTAIDGNAYTEDVWEWARKHPITDVIMVRGDNREAAPMLAQVKKEKDKRGRSLKYQRRFFNFNASVMKAALYRSFKKEDQQQTGYVDFASGLGDDFFQQVTSERRVQKKNRAGHSFYEWELPSGVRNEALDMMNQAQAAALRIGINYWTEDEWDALSERLSQEPKPAQMDLEDLMHQPQVNEASVPIAANQSMIDAAIARAKQRASRRGI
ncbi:phage terminase large subunit family protein [Paenochrobactrum sp. BZR 588]|uniref:phage terminase large subunit family protein n=1 Tax=unclassified Paenochrobactrum TaxID=2639760 RepID=UPI003851E2C6